MEFDPNDSVTVIRALLIGVLGLALLMASVIGVFSAGRKGDSGKAARILAASLIALFPAVIAVAIGVIAFGSAVWGWAIPGLSS